MKILKISLLCLALFLGRAKSSPETQAIPLLLELSNADPNAPEEDLVKVIEEVESKMNPKIKSLRRFPEDIQGFEQVETSSGMLIGQTNTHSHSFYGVPFAEPPTGELRYMPPKAKGNAGTLNVSTPNDIVCYQKCSSNCPKTYTEDCLFLNVFVPNTVDLQAHASDDSSSSKIPVMFFIHGGGFQIGTAMDDTFDSTLFVEYTNTVVVVANYRVGPLGFMVYEADGVKFEGNQGLKDQQLALQWVQDNIGKFGGDKTQVTVMGQSAGAQSVIFHFLSPNSKSLFSRGIPQSAPMVFQYDDPKKAHNTTMEMIDILSRKKTNLHCKRTGLECLRDTDPQTVMGAATNIQVRAFRKRDAFGLVEPFRPVIDGVEYKNQPLELFQRGEWNTEKEMIVGSMKDELAQTITIFRKHPAKWPLYAMLNQIVLGKEMAAVALEKYGQYGDRSDPGYDWTRIMTDELNDMFFTCPIRLMSEFASATTPLYMYVNSHPGKNGACDHPNETYYPCGYATHASELPFEFRTGPSQGIPWTPADFTVSDMIDDYWGSFAHNARPTSQQYTAWPLYKQNNNGEWPNMHIKAPDSEVQLDHMKDICDFWDSLNYYVVLNTPRPYHAGSGTIGGNMSVMMSLLVLVLSLLV